MKPSRSGEVSLQQARALLSGADAAKRMRGAWALGRMGPTAKVAADELLRALRDDRYYVRGNAAWALGQIQADAPAVLTALAGALDDEVVLVGQCAAEALGGLGTSAAATVLEGVWKEAVDSTPRSADADAAAAEGGKCQPATLALDALGRMGPAGVDSLARAMACGDKDIAVPVVRRIRSAGQT